MKLHVIIVLLSIITIWGCTSKLAYKPALTIYSDNDISINKYESFEFKMTGDSLDYLLEKYLQNHLAILLESKGFERTNSPDFYISINWETIEDQILYDTGFLVAGESSLGYFAYWSELSSSYIKFFKHRVTISIQPSDLQNLMWRVDTQIVSVNSDIRYSVNTMFKNAIYRFPSRGQNTRKGAILKESTLSDNEKFQKYVEEYIYNRDFSFPGFDFYVTFTPKRSLKTFSKAVAKLSDSPEYFPLYIDLLEYGVYYHIEDNKILNLIGIYDVEGEIIYVKIRAKKYPDTSKYKVSSLELVDLKQYNKDIEIIREIELKKMYLHDFFK